MVTYQVIDSFPPFDWGAAVKPINEDVAATYGISSGSICGFTVLKSDKQGDNKPDIGDIIALVEDSGGRAAEIPLSLLMLLE